MSSALDMQRERAELLARELVAKAPPGSIASIFAGGSLGRGEVWAAEIDGTLEIYSDIDLYVVSAQDVTAGRLRDMARSLPPPAPPSGVRFLRSADIGVYTRADLSDQPLRPGTAELDRYHLMLHGDENIPRGMSDRDAAQIPAQEALYLLENRVWDFSSQTQWDEHTPAARLALAKALKAEIDVYTAHAIVAGAAAATFAQRAEGFRVLPPATMEEHVRALVSSAFEGVRDLGAAMHKLNARSECARALYALVEAWSALAPRVLNVRDSPAGLVARRSRSGALASNTLDVLRLRRRFSLPLMNMVLALPALARRSPIDALRLHALVECFVDQSDRRMFSGHYDYVDNLTRQFHFYSGRREERVHAMHTAVS